MNLIKVLQNLGIWNKARYLLLRDHGIKMTPKRLEQMKNYKMSEKERKQ